MRAKLGFFPGVYLAATVILAALVHFVVVLATPFVASDDAFQRLAALGGPNVTVLLPRSDPSQETFPYGDPAVAMSFCRYDLASGPLRVTAPAGRSFASISFHARRGLIFYSLTDKAAAHGLINAVIGTAEQVQALAANDSEEDPSRDLRVIAPAREGYVLMRAFSDLPSLYPQAEAEAKRLACAPEPMAKVSVLLRNGLSSPAARH